MRRKIPGKKHRGVKDPLEQNARRNAALLKKINAPPPNPDEQDLPRSLERIMKLKQAVKEGAFKKRRKKRRGEERAQRRLPAGMTRPEKPTPVFKRLPGESHAQFVERVDAECQEVIDEAKYEKEFGVTIQRDPETGEVSGIVKQEKTELDRIMERYARKGGKQEEKAKKKGQEHNSAQHQGLSKRERWKLKKKEKLLKSKEKEVDEFERFKDDVKFGEVVHAPPVLKAPRKAAAINSNTETVPRPGKRHLLLTSLLNPTADKVTEQEKLRRELQRQSVVEAYRQLKARRGKQHEARAPVRSPQ